MFQLNGLRKILRLQTTHVERANSTEVVYRLAEATANESVRGKKTISKVSDAYESWGSTLLQNLCLRVLQALSTFFSGPDSFSLPKVA